MAGARIAPAGTDVDAPELGCEWAHRRSRGPQGRPARTAPMAADSHPRLRRLYSGAAGEGTPAPGWRSSFRRANVFGRSYAGCNQLGDRRSAHVDGRFGRSGAELVPT